MSVRHIAICTDGLSNDWLGGMNYFRNLVAAFDGAQADDLKLHVLTDHAGFLDGLALSNRVEVHVLPMLRRRSLAWAARKARQVVTGRDVALLAVLRRLKVSAVVFSFVAGAKRHGIRCVPWVPDFQFVHHPEFFPPAIVAAERRRTARYLAVADSLVVSSQVARNDAIAHFNARPQDTHVLRFVPCVDSAPLCSTALRDTVLQRYGVTQPYLFLPNQYWKHKNHELVVQAMGSLVKQGQPLPLVLSTGKTQDFRNPDHFASVLGQITALGIETHYRVLGIIPRQDMLVLLAHSGAVLNPSRFEGWSTTVEEAKALGKQLLLSDIPVHREQVAGVPGVQMFGPSDAAAMARLLSAWYQHNGHAAVGAFPPQPDRSLYGVFEAEYIALLRQLAAPVRHSQ